MIFSYETVGFGTESHNNVSESSVVHIHTSLPDNASGIDSLLIALLNVVIKKCGKKIVSSGDCVEVTGEMKVKILHGNNLCHSAACSTALDSEAGSE